MGISPAEYLRQQTITEARRKDRSAVLAAAREALSRSPGPASASSPFSRLSTRSAVTDFVVDASAVVKVE